MCRNYQIKFFSQTGRRRLTGFSNWKNYVSCSQSWFNSWIDVIMYKEILAHLQQAECISPPIVNIDVQTKIARRFYIKAVLFLNLKIYTFPWFNWGEWLVRLSQGHHASCSELSGEWSRPIRSCRRQQKF